MLMGVSVIFLLIFQRSFITQSYFGIYLPSAVLRNRTEKFEQQVR